MAADAKFEDFTLTLELEGEKLSGTAAWPDGERSAIGAGKFKDGNVSFNIDRGNFLQQYSGKLKGDTIKGKWAAGIAVFDWQAQRRRSR